MLPETQLSKDEEIAALQRTVARLTRQYQQLVDTTMAEVARLNERIGELESRVKKIRQRPGRPPKGDR